MTTNNDENHTRVREYVAASLTEFNQVLDELHQGPAGRSLYRGLASSDWQILSSADLRLQQEQQELPVYAQSFQLNELETLVLYNEERIADFKHYGFDWDYPQHDLAQLEIITLLRHYGCSCSAIDFTSNPHKALWFAAQPPSGASAADTGKDGVVYLLNISDRAKFVEIYGNKALREFSIARAMYEQPQQWFYWGPRYTSRRILAQDSHLLLGAQSLAAVEARPYILRIIIPAAAKPGMLRALAKYYSISEFMLFPDLVGYAQVHAASRPYSITEGAVSKLRFFDKEMEQVTAKLQSPDLKPEERAALEEKAQGLHFRRAVLHAGSLAEYQEAVSELDSLLKLRPDDACAYSNRGLAKAGLEDYDGAMKDFAKSLELAPAIADTYFKRGVAYMSFKMYEQAIADYKKAAELEPNNPVTYNNIGDAYVHMGSYKESLANYDKALEINPNYAAVYANRAEAKNALGNYAEALADYDAALALNPKNASAYCNRGAVQSKIGNHKDAIADYDKAIALDPEYAMAYYGIGYAQTALGNYKEAIKNCDTALMLDPNLNEAKEQRDKSLADLTKNK